MTRLAGDSSQARPTISEAEFRTAIEIGEEEGVVEERAAEMLHNVFEFGDRKAREILVPGRDTHATEQVIFSTFVNNSESQASAAKKTRA